VLDLGEIRSGNMFAGAYDLIENHCGRTGNILIQWSSTLHVSGGHWKVARSGLELPGGCMADQKSPIIERFCLSNENTNEQAFPKIIHYTEH